MHAKRLAGDGMLCRDVAERARAGSLKVQEGTIWHIVGLNALNNCEKALFKLLRQTGQAKFYWDDAHFFMNDPDHKASVFIRENRRLFGNELGPAEDHEQTIPRGEWNIIDTPSDTAQARLVSQLLDNNEITGDTDLTATREGA